MNEPKAPTFVMQRAQPVAGPGIEDTRSTGMAHVAATVDAPPPPRRGRAKPPEPTKPPPLDIKEDRHALVPHWELTLADLREQRDAIDTAIAALEALYR